MGAFVYVQDDSADNAVGNVTGSNAVNVFLGLGLPWGIASVYWSYKGPTAEWRDKYPDIALRYPEGGFAVPAGNLAFSVTVFTGCAFVSVCVLLLRRRVYGAELGGKKSRAYVSSAFLVLLWFVYIALSALRMFGFV